MAAQEPEYPNQMQLIDYVRPGASRGELETVVEKVLQDTHGYSVSYIVNILLETFEDDGYDFSVSELKTLITIWLDRLQQKNFFDIFTKLGILEEVDDQPGWNEEAIQVLRSIYDSNRSAV